MVLSGSGDVLGEVIDAYEIDGRCFYLIERPEGTLWSHDASRFNIRSKAAIATAEDVVAHGRASPPPPSIELPPRRLVEQHQTSGKVEEVPTSRRDSESLPVSDAPVPPAAMPDRAAPEQSPGGIGKSEWSSRYLVVGLVVGAFATMGLLIYRLFLRDSGGRASARSSSDSVQTDNRAGLQGDPVVANVPARDTPVSGQPRPKVSNDAEWPVLDRRPAPEQRGGRPRAPAEAEAFERNERVVRNERAVSLRSELVCWKSGRQWFVGVEVPEPLSEAHSPHVLQAGRTLERDEVRENCWRMQDLKDDVQITSADTSFVLSVRQSSESPFLAFKCRRDGRHGRRVRAVSEGIYVIVVPEKWSPDPQLAVTVVAGPEPTSIEGHHGYLFDVEGSERIIFRTLTEASEVDRRSRVELFGHRVLDGSARMGPLFGQRPPMLRAPAADFWDEIATIVVGEEGRGRARWKHAFEPVLGTRDQDLSAILSHFHCGWFFVRLYDSYAELLDSFDFRFVRPLRDIALRDLSSLPGSAGHRPVAAEFMHEAGCEIVAEIPPRGSVLPTPHSGVTVATIPATPEADETRWLLTARPGRSVQATIVVERLWWALGDERTKPATWTDMSVELTASDFVATSPKALWFHVRRPRHLTEVLVGFDRLHAHRVGVRGGSCTIPLRNFSDAEDLRGTSHAALKIWLPEPSAAPSIVVKVLIRLSCKLCGALRNPDDASVRMHLISEHVEDLFRILSYEETAAELRDELPTLPKAIYKCSYCDFYTSDEPHEHPTSVIERHIDRECRAVGRDAGPPPVRFRVVHDVAQVRRLVRDNLPTFHECTRCGTRLRDVAPEQQAQHLLAAHRSMLFEVT